MPGIVSFGGIDDGEGFGVGEGVAMGWPACCASTGQKAKRIIEIGNNRRSILKLPPESVADCLSKWRGLNQRRAMLREHKLRLLCVLHVLHVTRIATAAAFMLA
jgi:hypothetical protein